MYTDPGTGLFYVQVALVGGLTVLYRVRRLIAGFFQRRSGPKMTTE